jgi:hypothetical protein
MRLSQLTVVLLVMAAFVSGCSKGPTDPVPVPSDNSAQAEAAVREKFVEVQSAIKAKDTDKLWGLLSKKSQAEAETRAKEIRTAYEQSKSEERSGLEKEWGLPGAELAKLTGVGVLKTSRFVRKVDEIAESTITRVSAASDTGTVYFDEPDGDHEKLNFVREEGQWKAWMTIPKMPKR